MVSHTQNNMVNKEIKLPANKEGTTPQGLLQPRTDLHTPIYRCCTMDEPCFPGIFHQCGNKTALLANRTFPPPSQNRKIIHAYVRHMLKQLLFQKGTKAVQHL